MNVSDMSICCKFCNFMETVQNFSNFTYMTLKMKIKIGYCVLGIDSYCYLPHELQMIYETHTTFILMQHLLLFPYDNGYQKNIVFSYASKSSRMDKRKHISPHEFILFYHPCLLVVIDTCSTIVKMLWLNIGRLHAYDKSGVTCILFHIKLEQLMHNLKKDNFFGKVNACMMYIAEFQKHDLLHAHILLWLGYKDIFETP
ncbi:hypothetical protein CR513_20766, partial [Mucuna pruriens]